MRLIVTPGDVRLTVELLRALSSEHEVRLLTHEELLDAEVLKEAVKGGEAILHLLPTNGELGTEFESLDLVGRGTYQLMCAANEAGIDKVIVGSSLSLFDRHPQTWKVDEQWRPRPLPVLADLVPWIGELSVCEGTRASSACVVCLRFGKFVTEEESRELSFDPRWVHIEDAVAATLGALNLVHAKSSMKRWHVFHIPGKGERSKIRIGSAGQSAIAYEPKHDFSENQKPESTLATTGASGKPWREVLAPIDPIPTRPIKKVVIFGAGGPVASELIRLLAPNYTLRITDLKPIAEIIAENKPQFPGAPMPTLFGAPHETFQVDVRDADQVDAACEGMDAIINCTVLRHDPVLAFHVNTIGAYHIGLAAVKHRIRRLVHTGPQLLTMDPMEGYYGQYEIPGDAPMRPGTNLYAHSKYLGQEILRTFAETYDLEIPVLLYSQFVNAEVERWIHAMAITWHDSALALKCALEAPSLPTPYEVMHILADLPHQQFSPLRAWELLGWRSKEDMQSIWERQT